MNPASTTAARAKAIDLESVGLSVKIPNALNSKSLILRGIYSNNFLSNHNHEFRLKNYLVLRLIDVAFFEVPKFTSKVQQFSRKEVRLVCRNRSASGGPTR